MIKAGRDFKEVQAKVIDESRHTINILPDKWKLTLIVSKRDVAVKKPNEAKSQKNKERQQI